ncbi:hypothetical protein NDU88_002790 [Pleurodeles waltl]|uniref:Uncharacterized protein n=1 Tax=Pleurodeles waltl TaxID=8319 RepID=A0AAV7WQI4_PLEWA|nr:hypothetical protein NDU88_002790 [Pleurodeles waltl]
MGKSIVDAGTEERADVNEDFRTQKKNGRREERVETGEEGRDAGAWTGIQGGTEEERQRLEAHGDPRERTQNQF